MNSKDISVSIVVATYNGEKYLRKQLDSIVCQVRDNDEVIISDDGSTDSTIDIIEEYKKMYHQIKFIAGPQKGVFQNFIRSIDKCSNEIIFLSDQDDIWDNAKIETVLNNFMKDKTEVILHNGICFDEDGDLDILIPVFKHGVIRNLIKSKYWGCCMAFKRDIAHWNRLFSFNGVGHDQLIGLIGEYRGTAKYVDEPLVRHRIHGNNLTYKKNYISRIIFRIKLITEFYLTGL